MYSWSKRIPRRFGTPSTPVTRVTCSIVSFTRLHHVSSSKFCVFSPIWAHTFTSFWPKIMRRVRPELSRSLMTVGTAIVTMTSSKISCYYVITTAKAGQCQSCVNIIRTTRVKFTLDSKRRDSTATTCRNEALSYLKPRVRETKYFLYPTRPGMITWRAYLL